MARTSGGKKNLADILSNINRDVKALNSSILIISQKMKHLARNEKILGRNLIVVNNKVKELRQEVKSRPAGGGESIPQPAVIAAEIPADLQETLAAIQSSLEALKDQANELSADHVSKADFREVKFVVDSIDPLKFATLSQLNQALAGRKIKPAKAKKKSAKKKSAKKKRKKKK